MKGLRALLLLVAFAATARATDAIADFCAAFAPGSKVLVFRGLPHPKFALEARERAEAAEHMMLLGEAFYPESKELASEDAKAWLARATDPASYYPSQQSGFELDGGFHADVAFWCITADQKKEAHCLFSFATREVRIFLGGGGATVAMTLELEKLSREIPGRCFKAEIENEANQ